MPKYLTGSTTTGEKIYNNIFDLKSNFTKKENDIYSFSWTFGNQHGYINILVRDGKMSNSSVINTDNDSPHKFSRPLGLYNDETLIPIFTKLMNSQNIKISGVFCDN